MSRTASEVMAHIRSMIGDLPDGYDTVERRTSIAVSCALAHVALGHTNTGLYGILLTWWQGTVQRGADPHATVALHLDFYGPSWIRDAAVLVPLCDQISEIVGGVDLLDDGVCAARWAATAAAMRPDALHRCPGDLSASQVA